MELAGKAMRSTGLVGTPDGKSAWIFENQTGVLGNTLNSSVLYMGITGDVNVIVAGTSLASNRALSSKIWWYFMYYYNSRYNMF